MKLRDSLFNIIRDMSKRKQLSKGETWEWPQFLKILYRIIHPIQHFKFRKKLRKFIDNLN